MTNITRRQALTGLAAGAATLLSARVSAEGPYPSRPISLVVAFPTGGDTDALGRLFADKLSARLKQPVVVENRTGAAGTIGSAYVAKAKPDGHTLLFAPNTVAIAPWVLKTGTGMVYDPRSDLTPIAMVGTQSLFVIVNKDAGVTNMKELVAQAKAGRLTSYASPGSGSPMHILGELFNKAAGVKITQIPYRGSGPAVVDLVGGQVPLMYSTLGPVEQYLASGKLLNLAVADEAPSPFAPNVPTLISQGFANVVVGAWQAIVGPKGMDPAIVQTLNAHINEICQMPDVIARMKPIAITPATGRPEELGKVIVRDSDRYAKLIDEFGIRPE